MSTTRALFLSVVLTLFFANSLAYAQHCADFTDEQNGACLCQSDGSTYIDKGDPTTDCPCASNEEPLSSTQCLCKSDLYSTPGKGTPASSCPAFTAHPLAPNTLAIYNSNDPDASDIASYYASERGLASGHTCAVTTPVGVYMTSDQFFSLRHQVLNCICDLIPSADKPDPCDETATVDIAHYSPISHITTIKLPNWVTVSAGGPSASVDYYLAHYLYKPNDLTNTTWNTTQSPLPTPIPFNRAPRDEYLNSNFQGFTFGSSGNVDGTPQKPINTQTDRMVVYGRIDGLSKESAKSLIHRTRYAEAHGLTGNFVAEVYHPNVNNQQNDIVSGQLLDLTNGKNDTNCTAYFSGTPWAWPSSGSSSCRTGIAQDGYLPGLSCVMPNQGATTVRHCDGSSGSNSISSYPGNVNVGLLLGQDSERGQDSQFCQGGFSLNANAMQSFRVAGASSSCSPTCGTDTTCRALSKDFFHELNSSCVGVARGFMANQETSFSAQYYGIFPQGWGTFSDQGDKVPPTAMSGDGYNEGNFQSGTYIRFGQVPPSSSDCSSGGNPTACCAPVTGTTPVACPNLLAINLIPQGLQHLERYVGQVHPQDTFPFASPISIQSSGDLHVRVKFRYRNSASTNGTVHIKLRWYDQAGYSNQVTLNDVALGTAHEGTSWEPYNQVATIPYSSLNGTNSTSVYFFPKFLADIGSPYGDDDHVTGYFDLGNVELIDDDTSTSLLASDIGGFSAHNVSNLTYGDYPANVIDRLNGIAYWGSGSHFKSDGHAYERTQHFVNALMTGRSLGESVYVSGTTHSTSTYNGNYYNASGVLYGDPLYSPAAAYIYLKNSSNVIKPAYSPLSLATYTFSDNSTTEAAVYINAKQGKATTWDVSKCTADTTVAACDSNNHWSSISSGTSGQTDHQVASTLASLRNGTTTQYIFLRLKVYPTGNTTDALYSYAYLHYVP